MAPKDFERALKELGWKQSDFCRMADVDKNTPSRWMNGITPIPGWAKKFLDMAQEIKRLSKLIDPVLQRKEE